MRILVLSNMRDMSKSSSSTQMMVYNLVWGLHQIGAQITMIPVLEKGESVQNIRKDLSTITCEILPMPSALNLLVRQASPFKSMLSNWLWSKRKYWYKRKLKAALDRNAEYDVILALLPNIEAAYYAEAAHLLYPTVRYIQFWSDPYCRSNLSTSDTVPLKRVLLKKIESSIIKKADRIVYGTETLFQTQKECFPSLRKKMFSCDVSYNVYGERAQKKISFFNNELVSGYIGNYFTEIRNIKPCYDAFAEDSELGNLILCGAGNIHFESTLNIKVLPRCAPAEATAIENGLDILICLLNSKTSQIPGKIFYQANSGKPIIVILDGPDKDLIRKYLSKFNRFEFCDNNHKSISECIKRVKAGDYTASLKTPHILSPAFFAKSVIGE